MKLKEKIVTKLNRYRLTRRLLDYDFRTVMFTVFSFIITTGYAVFYGTLGVMSHSLWYGMLAWYYLMIVIMRSFVVFYHKGRRKREKKEVKRNERLSRARVYRNCGMILCLLMLPLSLAVMQMVATRATFSYAGLMIYATATYTTYKVIMAIRNFLKAKNSDYLTVRTARDINLADMLVSVLALQTAMFNSFSPELDTSVYNAITGAAVCALTVIIGLIMVIKGNREVKLTKCEEKLQ